MHSLIKNILRFTGIAILILSVIAIPALSQDWEDGFPVRITYQELDGVNFGSVDVDMTMTFPMGTPLLARETAMRSALSALHDIWNIESVHEDVRVMLGPVVPMDVQRTVSGITGSRFIIAMMDAFETVSDAGFSRFQVDTSITATERVMAPRRAAYGEYPDAPRFFAWVIGEGWPEGGSGHENWVIASMINYSASILSFRSELGRFPRSFAELRENNQLLIEPLNPYTGEPVKEVTDISPGDISYRYIDNNRVVLLTYIQVGNQSDVVRREINVSSSGAFDLLYRQTSDLSETDKQVARYIFQIAQILNEYYYQHLDLPYRVPQCEAEGFAYVSFMNPYTLQDAQQTDALTQRPGDYTYNRISSSAYFLVGYGNSGIAILRVSKDFAAPDMEMGTLRTQ